MTPGRLPRELVRQSLLATAGEFDIVVRDAALGETAPDGETRVLRMRSLLFPHHSLSVDVEDGGQSSYDRRDIKVPDGILTADIDAAAPPAGWGRDDIDLLPLVRWAAALEAEFRAHFKQLGLRPRRAGASPPDTGDIALRLREMSVTPQFEAVRLAHALPLGAERDRLLAIGYANLGLLTQHLWSPASKVFIARSLIYAERAAVEPSKAEAAEVRAYAAGLAGLHAAALEQVEAAGAETAPRRLAISAYCRFRDDELWALSEREPEVRELAAVLACLAAAGYGDDTRLAEAYQRAVEVAPDCFRLDEPVTRPELLGLMHEVSVRGLGRLVRDVPARLRAVSGLPASVRTLVADAAVSPADLADALEGESGLAVNGAGISWPVLGRLVRDETLVQAHRRLWFLTLLLGVPAGEEHDRLLELVGGHPLAEVALAPLSDFPDRERIREAARGLHELGKYPDPSKSEFWSPRIDFGPSHLPFLRSLLNFTVDAETYRSLRLGMKAGRDLTADDMQRSIAEDRSGLRSPKIDGVRREVPSREPAFLRLVAMLSPHHPAPVVYEMRSGSAPPERLAALEKDFADRPVLLRHLSEALLAADKTDDAVRVAARATELSPSFDALRALAEAHLAAGREADYVAALERALEHPTYGLADARARVELASHFMNRGDYESAEPYAEAAAESYAGWAIYPAINCYTALGKWDLAELWAARVAQRYPQDSGADWYLWCRLNGRGNAGAAKAYADAWASQLEVPLEETNPTQLFRLAYYRLIVGEAAAAASAFETLARMEKGAGDALIAAAVDLHIGRRDAARDILRFAASLEGDAATRAGVLLNSLESGEPLPSETVAEFGRAVETFKGDEPRRFRTVFGEIFVHLGNRDEGLDFLRHVADLSPRDAWFGGNPYDRIAARIWLDDHLAGRWPAARSARSPVEAPRP